MIPEKDGPNEAQPNDENALSPDKSIERTDSFVDEGIRRGGGLMEQTLALSARIADLKAEVQDVEEDWALMVVVCGKEEDRFKLAVTETTHEDQRFLGAMYRKKGRQAEVVINASQIWLSSSELPIQPCDDPDRKEGKAITALSRDGFGLAAITTEEGIWEEQPITGASAPMLAQFWKGYEEGFDRKPGQGLQALRVRWLTPMPCPMASLETLNNANLSDADLAGLLRVGKPREWLCAKPRERRRMIQDFRRKLKEEHRWN